MPPLSTVGTRAVVPLKIWPPMVVQTTVVSAEAVPFRVVVGLAQVSSKVFPASTVGGAMFSKTVTVAVEVQPFAEFVEVNV